MAKSSTATPEQFLMRYPTVDPYEKGMLGVSDERATYLYNKVIDWMESDNTGGETTHINNIVSYTSTIADSIEELIVCIYQIVRSHIVLEYNESLRQIAELQSRSSAHPLAGLADMLSSMIPGAKIQFMTQEEFERDMNGQQDDSDASGPDIPTTDSMFNHLFNNNKSDNDASNS